MAHLGTCIASTKIYTIILLYFILYHLYFILDTWHTYCFHKDVYFWLLSYKKAPKSMY